MPEVQNIGAVDYAQQYQPSQYQPSQYQQYDDYAENYGTQPEVYDEQAAEMQQASKSRLGATALATLIVALGTLGGGYYWGNHSAKGANAAKEAAEKAKETAESALQELKDSEAVKYYDKLKEVTTQLHDIATENAGNFFGKNRVGRGFKDKMDELLTPIKEAISKDKEKAAEKAAEETKKIAEEAKEAVEEAV